MLDWGIADNATPPHVFVSLDDEKVLVLPDTDHNRVRAEILARGAKFAIGSASERGYWSNDLGWVYDSADATRFDPADLSMNLPMTHRNDAEWVVVEFAPE